MYTVQNISYCNHIYCINDIRYNNVLKLFFDIIFLLSNHMFL